MTQKMIIDGYNVIYTDDQLRPVMIRNSEKARERFLEMLKDYLRGKSLRVTVVFDGSGDMVDTVTVVAGKLQVVFSRRHESADELIMATLRGSNNPREFIVVTSDDVHIGKEARSLGSLVIRSRRFIERIREEEAGRDSRAEKPDPDEDDVRHWLRMFGKEEHDM